MIPAQSGAKLKQVYLQSGQPLVATRNTGEEEALVKFELPT
jgi:hypothetical protein